MEPVAAEFAATVELLAPSTGVLSVANHKSIVKKATGSRKTDMQASVLALGTRAMLAKIHAGEKLGTAPAGKDEIAAALTAHWGL